MYDSLIYAAAGQKYSIILADPPWTYRDKAVAGRRGAAFKYSVQSRASLENLPVVEIVSNNCFLFLWVTMPMLGQVFDLFPRWGFKYKTVAFNWIKTNKKSPSLFWGMGNWTRANSELCLLGIRGKPKRMSASVHSVVLSAIKGHSEKPWEVHERILKLCGDLPRMELFARKSYPGWDSWGDELK